MNKDPNIEAASGASGEESRDSRTRRLLGDEAMDRLASARVLVVGVGGVGGYAAEILARTGVGHLTLVDADTVAPSNLNRQLIATISTIGKVKTDLFAQRFRDINPEIEVEALELFVTPDNIGDLLDRGYDYVVDCIDTVAPKTELLAECLKRHIPVISSMGAGGRVDPTKVVYTDLWETREDGLARAVRQRLKKMGLRRTLRVVASEEAPRAGAIVEVESRNKRTSFGTTATIPAIFGIYMANHVIMKLSNLKKND